jgi:transposase, IS5 family
MIKYTSQNQLSVFQTPFDQQLDPNNRWVKLSNSLPWDQLVKIYIKKLRSDFGAPGIDGRMVIGSLIIKHKLTLSDRETIEMIRENMYMQYFVGLSSFTTDPIFHHTEFVHIRKRLSDVDFNSMTEELMQVAGIIEKQQEQINDTGKNENKRTPEDIVDDNEADKNEADKIVIPKATLPAPEEKQVDEKELIPEQKAADDIETITNKGDMQLDATVADQKIKYPNDVELLNTGRQETDRLMDLLCEDLEQKRPRTYRNTARKQFLRFAKRKTKPHNIIRKARRQQLNYLKRNFKQLDLLITKYQSSKQTLRLPFAHRDLRILWATRLVYDQQLQMHNENSQRISDRIVNIYQPYVRPIVRGKAKAKVEFGAKLEISLQDGYAFIETLSWDAFNECNDLQSAAENYKKRYGYYPANIIADAIYHTRVNKKWCTGNHIKLIGKTLSKTVLSKMTAKERKAHKQKHNSRNHVEGKFGQGKNAYELNEIKAKYSNTSKSWIAAIIFVMNILYFAGSSFLSFLAAMQYITGHMINRFRLKSTAIMLRAA